MEHDVVAATEQPGTVARLAGQLTDLGLPAGATVLVHSSLSKLGWVAGGAQAVVEALFRAAGPHGTLVMPTHSRQLTEPAEWGNPPVPESWWETIRQETPAFDPRITPTYFMGAVVDCFRFWPGVWRSYHPTVSFAACGPDAEKIVAAHGLDDGLGEASPLARLYELDAWVLLLGVGHQNNTSLHLAEYRAEHLGKAFYRQASPVLVDGVRRWVEYRELADDTSVFEQLGADFPDQVTGPVGAGTGRLMRQRALVDFGVRWMEKDRAAS